MDGRGRPITGAATKTIAKTTFRLCQASPIITPALAVPKQAAQEGKAKPGIECCLGQFELYISDYPVCMLHKKLIRL